MSTLSGSFTSSRGANLRNKYLFLFVISSSLIVIDQYTKFMVTLHIPLSYSINVVEGFFNLTHVRNSGVAFGIFSEQNSQLKPYLLIFVSIIAIIAILVIFHQTGEDKRMVQGALVLGFSGAIGNLIDRVLHKEVIDFIDIFFNNRHWPAFNVADACITIGVMLLAADLLLSSKGSNSPDSTA